MHKETSFGVEGKAIEEDKSDAGNPRRKQNKIQSEAQYDDEISSILQWQD